MFINKPTLPPVAGYVEVEHDGQRLYQSIETGELKTPPLKKEPTQVERILELEKTLSTEETKNQQLRADIDYIAIMAGVEL